MVVAGISCEGVVLVSSLGLVSVTGTDVCSGDVIGDTLVLVCLFVCSSLNFGLVGSYVCVTTGVVLLVYDVISICDVITDGAVVSSIDITATAAAALLVVIV